MNRDLKELKAKSRRYRKRRGRRYSVGLAFCILIGGIALAAALAGAGSAWVIVAVSAGLGAITWRGTVRHLRRIYRITADRAKAEGLVHEDWTWTPQHERAAIRHELSGAVRSLATVPGLVAMCIFLGAAAYQAQQVNLYGDPHGLDSTVITYLVAAGLSFLLSAWGGWRLLAGLFSGVVSREGVQDSDSVAEAARRQMAARSRDLAWVWGLDPQVAEDYQALVEIGRIFAFEGKWEAV